MSKTLFTADLHLGHVNILEYAPQRRAYLGLSADADVNDMNEGIVRLWNRQVDPDDTVFILGDIAMGRVAETIEFVRQMNGEKLLVPGNHDRVHAINYKGAEKHAEWARIYNDVGLIDIGFGPHMMTIDGIDCEVSHFPYEGSGDHTEEERYGEWRPTDAGLPLVHGHLHDLYQTSGRCFNVGMDAWDGRFITPEEIGAYFRSIGADRS